MREILFKAKRIDNGEWAVGSLFVEGNRTEIVRGTCNGVGIEGVDVNPETVCQYTGLTDRQGNKLWENDIVEIVSSPKTSYKHLLWWNKEMSLMDAIPLDGIDFNGHDYWNGNYPKFHYETFCTMMQDPWGDFSDIKVIGNIIDNPELVETR